VHTQVFDHLDPDGTRLTVLAERAQMSHQSMGELVGELVELGYLERVRDPADGRARLLRATPAGLRHIGGAVEHLVGIRERWQRELGGLAVDEVLHALRILTNICESVARPQHS
jgi:DNA-binding MarR family transcriptional regulator